MLRQRCRAIAVSALMLLFAWTVPTLALDDDPGNEADVVFVARLVSRASANPVRRRRDRSRPSLARAIASASGPRPALSRRSSHGSHRAVTHSRHPAFQRVVSTDL